MKRRSHRHLVTGPAIHHRALPVAADVLMRRLADSALTEARQHLRKGNSTLPHARFGMGRDEHVARVLRKTPDDTKHSCVAHSQGDWFFHTRNYYGFLVFDQALLCNTQLLPSLPFGLRIHPPLSFDHVSLRHAHTFANSRLVTRAARLELGGTGRRWTLVLV